MNCITRNWPSPSEKWSLTRGNAGMMQAGEQSRLALELFSQTLVGKQRLFQRDGGVETLIDRFVHGAHAALSELANDAITAL